MTFGLAEPGEAPDCVKCASKLKAGARFCVKCGTPVAKVEDSASAKSPVPVRRVEDTPAKSPTPARRVDEPPLSKSPPAAKSPPITRRAEEGPTKSPNPARRVDDTPAKIPLLAKSPPAVRPAETPTKQSPAPVRRPEEPAKATPSGSVCHSCSGALKPNALFCTKCGAKCADRPKPAAEPSTSPVKAAPAKAEADTPSKQAAAKTAPPKVEPSSGSVTAVPKIAPKPATEPDPEGTKHWGRSFVLTDAKWKTVPRIDAKAVEASKQPESPRRRAPSNPPVLNGKDSFSIVF